MKYMPVFFISLFFIFTDARATLKNIPSTATQYIFENLIRSTGDLKQPKAPVTVEANDVYCSTSLKKIQCRAIFKIDGKNIEKSISGDNDKFFAYLTAKSAIALNEIKLGGNEYKISKIKCSYSLEGDVYYRCESEVSVKF